MTFFDRAFSHRVADLGGTIRNIRAVDGVNGNENTTRTLCASLCKHHERQHVKYKYTTVGGPRVRRTRLVWPAFVASRSPRQTRDVGSDRTVERRRRPRRTTCAQRVAFSDRPAEFPHGRVVVDGYEPAFVFSAPYERYKSWTCWGEAGHFLFVRRLWEICAWPTRNLVSTDSNLLGDTTVNGRADSRFVQFCTVFSGFLAVYV